eukprot:gene9738-9540_t
MGAVALARWRQHHVSAAAEWDEAVSMLRQHARLAEREQRGFIVGGDRNAQLLPHTQPLPWTLAQLAQGTSLSLAPFAEVHEPWSFRAGGHHRYPKGHRVLDGFMVSGLARPGAEPVQIAGPSGPLAEVPAPGEPAAEGHLPVALDLRCGVVQARAAAVPARGAAPDRRPAWRKLSGAQVQEMLDPASATELRLEELRRRAPPARARAPVVRLDPELRRLRRERKEALRRRQWARIPELREAVAARESVLRGHLLAAMEAERRSRTPPPCGAPYVVGAGGTVHTSAAAVRREVRGPWEAFLNRHAHFSLPARFAERWLRRAPRLTDADRAQLDADVSVAELRAACAQLSKQSATRDVPVAAVAALVADDAGAAAAARRFSAVFRGRRRGLADMEG